MSLGLKPDYDKEDMRILKCFVIAGVIVIVLMVWWHSREGYYRFIDKCDARVERFWGCL
jgi:hypothetical protein